jgi:hypothetical protein
MGGVHFSQIMAASSKADILLSLSAKGKNGWRLTPARTSLTIGIAENH